MSKEPRRRLNPYISPWPDPHLPQPVPLLSKEARPHKSETCLLFVLLWSGVWRSKALDRALPGQVASPRLEIPTTAQHGALVSCLFSLMQQCQQICWSQSGKWRVSGICLVIHSGLGIANISRKPEEIVSFTSLFLASRQVGSLKIQL